MADIRKNYPLFGATAEFAINDTEELFAESLLDDAYELALRLQKIFNFYDEKSELSRLNSNRSINASPELLEIMKVAIGQCEATKGSYDITRGKNFLERKAGKPISNLKCSYKDIRIEGDKITLTHQDALVDLGSIAKGFIAERVALHLQKQGAESGYVDARGDIRVLDEPITVNVQHPRRDGFICSIRAGGVGIATSGDYRQYQSNYEESHILDKRNVISATVVAPDLTSADVYATVLMVCDEAIKQELLSREDLGILIVDRDSQVQFNKSFERLLSHAG